MENLALNAEAKKPKIYSLRCANLAHKLKKQGVALNRQAEKYYAPPTRENVKKPYSCWPLVRRRGEGGLRKPFKLPRSGIFHPGAKEIFSDLASYLKWYRKSGKYSPEGSG